MEAEADQLTSHDEKPQRRGPPAKLTFTHGRAQRATRRLQKELEKLRVQHAPLSVYTALEAAVIGLLELERRNELAGAALAVLDREV